MTEKQIYWQNHIKAWEDSGLTQKAYCDEHNLNISTFSYWRTRINKMTQKFIEIKPRNPIFKLSDILIILPNGITLKTNAYSGIQAIIKLAGLLKELA